MQIIVDFLKILPKDRLYIKTFIDSTKRVFPCRGEGTVNDKIACKASFTLVLKDNLIKI